VAVAVSAQIEAAVRFGGDSYLSASDHRIYFGLGPAEKVDRILVTWPAGRRNYYQDLTVDVRYRLCEGDPSPSLFPASALPSSSGDCSLMIHRHNTL
jgi:hypothetical protein